MTVIKNTCKLCFSSGYCVRQSQNANQALTGSAGKYASNMGYSLDGLLLCSMWTIQIPLNSFSEQWLPWVLSFITIIALSSLIIGSCCLVTQPGDRYRWIYNGWIIITLLAKCVSPAAWKFLKKRYQMLAAIHPFKLLSLEKHQYVS